MDAVLALDQGSHASRACLVDAHGEVRDIRTVAVATERRVAGNDEYIEHNPLELLASLQTCIAQLCAANPDVQWRAAGLATQRSTLLCCDRRTLEPLTPALSWQDRRNATWLESLRPHAERIRAITGLPLSPHYGAGKLRWCLDHDEPTRAAARTGALLALPLSAWLQARLTGTAPCVDPANASRTLLFDSAQLDWSDEMLQLFGIERGWLPGCGPTRGPNDNYFGSISLAGGIERVPLCAVSGDQSVVPFGFGPIDDATLYINLGTGAFLQRSQALRPAHPEPLLGSVLFADDSQRRYSLEGTINGAGSAIAVYCEQHHCDEASLWPAFEALDRNAVLPLFINTVGGLGSPWWRARVAGGFVAADSRAERLPDAGSGRVAAHTTHFGAVVESIAFLIAANAREFARGAPLGRVLVAGGLSRSNGLCRRIATLLGIPVLRGELEISARGIAAVAAPQFAHGWPAPHFEAFEPLADEALLARERAFAQELAARLESG